MKIVNIYNQFYGKTVDECISMLKKMHQVDRNIILYNFKVKPDIRFTSELLIACSICTKSVLGM